jgi:hypothetical protein
MLDFEEEQSIHRAWALRHPIEVIHILVCRDPEHRAEGDFWLALLGWDIETFVRMAFAGAWDRSA